MRLYAPPAGTEPVKTWHMAEHIDPTPATPFVRDVYVIQCPMDLPLIPLGQSNPLMLGQDHLEAIMRKHLEQRYGVHVELGTELVSFEQNDAHVSAVLQKRSAGTEEGTEEVVQVSYLVGTDGGRSKLALVATRRH